MRILGLSLQHFRNIEFVRLETKAARVFLVGPNGQGKTNLLEAVGLMSALRSFRSAETKPLIRQGMTEAALAFEVEHERQGETRLRVTLRGEGKEVWVDQERVARLADFVGLFPTVCFSSQDQLLVRGAPGGRRRWLDLCLASVDKGYLQALQTYHRGLAGRNALLKQQHGGAQLEAFDRAMAPAAAELVRRRAEGLAALGVLLTEAYGRIADHAEQAGFLYAPDWAGGTAADFVAKLTAVRERDLRLRSSSCGPHRDDFDFSLGGMPAKDFASEGQQRLLVVALRLAQSEWTRRQSGLLPVILADDVVGELDPERRRRFWQSIDPAAQVIATGTELPADLPGDWLVVSVKQGQFSAGAQPAST